MADIEMSGMPSATPSTSDERRPRRRRKTTRCCGLYSPMTPGGGGDQPTHGANQVDEQASVMAAAVCESRGVVYAFATGTKIHGMRNLYLARGQ